MNDDFFGDTSRHSKWFYPREIRERAVSRLQQVDRSLYSRARCNGVKRHPIRAGGEGGGGGKGKTLPYLLRATYTTLQARYVGLLQSSDNENANESAARSRIDMDMRVCNLIE